MTALWESGANKLTNKVAGLDNGRCFSRSDRAAFSEIWGAKRGQLLVGGGIR